MNESTCVCDVTCKGQDDKCVTLRSSLFVLFITFGTIIARSRRVISERNTCLLFSVVIRIYPTSAPRPCRCSSVLWLCLTPRMLQEVYMLPTRWCHTLPFFVKKKMVVVSGSSVLNPFQFPYRNDYVHITSPVHSVPCLSVKLRIQFIPHCLALSIVKLSLIFYCEIKRFFFFFLFSLNQVK